MNTVLQQQLFYLTSSGVLQAVYSSRWVSLVNSSVPFLQNCELGYQFVFHDNERANSCPNGQPRWFKFFSIAIPSSTNSKLRTPTSESSSGSQLDVQFFVSMEFNPRFLSFSRVLYLFLGCYLINVLICLVHSDNYSSLLHHLNYLVWNVEVIGFCSITESTETIIRSQTTPINPCAHLDSRFIKINFSNKTNNNQIFRNNFVCNQYLARNISASI